MNTASNGPPPPTPPPTVQQPLVGQGLIIEASRSHSNTPNSAGLFWTSALPVEETSTWQHITQKTEINFPSGIRTRNPSKRSATHPCIRWHGHWDLSNGLIRPLTSKPAISNLGRHWVTHTTRLCAQISTRLHSWSLSKPANYGNFWAE
jgi:hypothetical protein